MGIRRQAQRAAVLVVCLSLSLFAWPQAVGAFSLITLPAGTYGGEPNPGLGAGWYPDGFGVSVTVTVTAYTGTWWTVGYYCNATNTQYQSAHQTATGSVTYTSGSSPTTGACISTLGSGGGSVTVSSGSTSYGVPGSGGGYDPGAAPAATEAPPATGTVSGGTQAALCPEFIGLQKCRWTFATSDQAAQWIVYSGAYSPTDGDGGFVWTGRYAGPILIGPLMIATPGLDYGWQVTIGTGYLDSAGHNVAPCSMGGGQVIFYNKDGDMLTAPELPGQWPGQTCLVGQADQYGQGIKTRAPLGAVAQRLMIECAAACGGDWTDGGTDDAGKVYFVDVTEAQFDWESEADTVTDPTGLGNPDACDPNVDPLCYGPPSPARPCLVCNPDGGYGQVGYGCGPLSGLCIGKPFIGPLAFATCVRPNEALNVPGWLAFIGCEVSNAPAYTMNAIILLGNAVIDILFPGPEMDAVLFTFGDSVTAGPPFSWFSQLADGLTAAAATSGTTGGFPTFVVAGATIDVNPALTEAASGAAPYRGIMVAGVSLLFVMKALGAVVSVVSGGGVKSGSGDD